MNIPNNNYFNWSKTYAGAPIKESEQNMATLADSYKAAEGMHDLLIKSLSDINAPDTESQAYVDATKANIRDTLNTVAKDAQGRIRLETAEQTVKDLALKYSSDPVIKHIRETSELIKKKEEQADQLRSQGKAPVARGALSEQGIKDYKAISIDPKTGKPKLNKFVGWYEPHGDYDAAYKSLVSDLGYDDRDLLRGIHDKVKKKAKLTPTEEAYYKDTMADIVSNADKHPEIKQDIETLTGQFGSKEKAIEFMLKERIAPAINSRTKEENNAELGSRKAELMAENQLKRDKILAKFKEDQATKGFERRLELEQFKQDNKIEYGEKTGKIPTSREIAGSNTQKMFRSTYGYNEIASNPYNKSLKIESNTFNPDGSFSVKGEKDFIENKVKPSGSGELGGLNIPIKTYNKEKHANYNEAKAVVDDFRKSTPFVKDLNGKLVETKKLTDKQIAEIYNSATLQDTETRTRLADSVYGTVVAKQYVDDFYQKGGFSNINAAISGKDEGDKKPLMEKLIKNGFKENDLQDAKINFKGFRASNNATSNRALDGGLVYQINSKDGKKSEEITIPADDHIRNAFKQYNDFNIAALKTTMQNSHKGVNAAMNASTLLGNNVYLKIHKAYNAETNKLDTKFVTYFRDVDGIIKPLSDEINEKHKEYKGYYLDNEYSLEDLRNFALNNLIQTGEIQNRVASSKLVNQGTVVQNNNE